MAYRNSEFCYEIHGDVPVRYVTIQHSSVQLCTVTEMSTRRMWSWVPLNVDPKCWASEIPKIAGWSPIPILVGAWPGFNPLKKIRVRELGWWHSQYFWKIKIHVPNHQPELFHFSGLRDMQWDIFYGAVQECKSPIDVHWKILKPVGFLFQDLLNSIDVH